MKTAVWIFAALGAVGAAATVVLLLLAIREVTPMRIALLITTGALTFTFLLVALILTIIRQSSNPRVQAGLSGPATEQAVQALFTLQSPSLEVSRLSPSSVRIGVASVGAERGVILVPFVLRLEMEVIVNLDEQSRRYSFVNTWFESYGTSVSAQREYGVIRRREFGRYLTIDGIEAVNFDTGLVYQAIDGALAPLGWSR